MKLNLDRPVSHLDAAVGTEVVLRGSYTSSFDGSTIDAAATYWPDNAPGGASVDSGGLIDFAAGGLHLQSRDPDTHEVVAIVTDKPAPACDAAGVSAPCLVLRVAPQAQTRLITMTQWGESLNGQITVETVTPPPPAAYEPAVEAAQQTWVQGAALGLGLAVLAVGAALWVRRRRQSAQALLLALAKRVKGKLDGADAALSAPLAPTVDAAIRSLRGKRVSAESIEGKRVWDALLRVEQRLDHSAEQDRADREQEAADELVIEMEAALEAADETLAAGAVVTGRARS